MARMRALRKQEDIDKVPAEESVLIETAEEQPKPNPAEEVEIDFGAATDAVKPKPEPEPKPEPQAEPEDEAKTALAKRVQELEEAERTSKELLRQRNEQLAEYQRRVALQTQETEKAHKEQVDRDLGYIDREIQNQQQMIETARRDLIVAKTNGDVPGEVEATERLNDAKAEVRRYQEHRDRYQQLLETPAPQPQQQMRQPAGDPLDYMENVTEKQRQWLKDHREIFNDQRKLRKAGVGVDEAIAAGHPIDSPSFFQFIDEYMGFRKPQSQPEPEPEPEAEPEPQPTRRSIVAAPVSRNPPSPSSGKRESDTRVVLTPQEREIAKLSGVSETEYAAQKIAVQRARANGTYRDNTQ